MDNYLYLKSIGLENLIGNLLLGMTFCLYLCCREFVYVKRLYGGKREKWVVYVLYVRLKTNPKINITLKI